MSLRNGIDFVIMRNEGSMFYISYIWILRKLRITKVLIYSLSKRPFSYDALICTKSHIRSLGRESLLVLHDMDNIMETFWSEFGTRCIRDT